MCLAWTSSERLMYVQFTSCVYGGYKLPFTEIYTHFCLLFKQTSHGAGTRENA